MGKLDFPTRAASVPAPHAAVNRLRERVLGIFNSQRSAFEKALAGLGKAEESTERKLWLAIASYYNLLPDLVEPVLQQEATESAINAATEAGISPSQAIESFTPARQYARDRAAEMVGMRRNAGTGALEENADARWVISDTTRDNIREAVEKALSGELKDEAGNPLDLQESVRRQLLDSPSGPFSDYRAQMIARTEIKNARSFGKMETWKRLGVKAARWATTGDDRVCPLCVMNEGAVRPLGEPFPSGYRSPLDSHPQCRCFLIPESIPQPPMAKSTMGIPKTWTAYFVRHGETEANEDDRARGWGKWPLTEEGKRQAEEAGQFLVGHGITKIISSDLPRAKQTAGIVSRILGVPVEYSKEIRSLNVGEFTGADKGETRDRFLPYLREPKRQIPGGESIAGFIKRVVKFVLKDVSREPDETLLFVTHSSDIGALSYSINRASLMHLADNEVVMPGGVAKLGSGEFKAVFRAAPPRKGEME